MDIFVASNNERLGPFTREQLVTAIQQKRVLPEAEIIETDGVITPNQLKLDIAVRIRRLMKRHHL